MVTDECNSLFTEMVKCMLQAVIERQYKQLFAMDITEALKAETVVPAVTA